MKAKVFACLSRIETAIYRREVFAALSWLAVVLALISVVGGSRLAIASCAVSLAILAHISIVLLGSAGTLASSFNAIQQLYRKEVDGSKKEPQQMQADATKIN